MHKFISFNGDLPRWREGKKLPLSIFTASFTNSFHCRYDCNNSFYGQRLLLEGRADFVHIAFCALQRAPAVGSFNDLEKICFDMLWLSCENSFFFLLPGKLINIGRQTHKHTHRWTQIHMPTHACTLLHSNFNFI